MTGPGLTEQQIQRYSRHILLPGVGGEGQKKLLRSSAFVVGAGGLGSAALFYLAAAGVGRLGIADNDVVDLSNLQRQILHGTGDIGRSKVVSAQEAIARINPDCQVRLYPERLDASNIRKAIEGYDVVLDGSDNFATRYVVADCCWTAGVALVSAAVLRFEGQLMTIVPAAGNPCYRCLYPEPPLPGEVPSCQEAGVFNAVVGVMGTLQAVEALKFLLGVGKAMTDRLLVYDALRCRFLSATRRPDPSCPLCGAIPRIAEAGGTGQRGRSMTRAGDGDLRNRCGGTQR